MYVCVCVCGSISYQEIEHQASLFLDDVLSGYHSMPYLVNMIIRGIETTHKIMYEIKYFYILLSYRL